MREQHPIENTESTEAGILLAPHDTLLGQLQRGRGAGFLRALQEDSTTSYALLYKCITDDPRIDHQVEERADYYARLVLLMGMSLSTLENYLRTVPHKRLGWETTLAIETLGRLAQLGSIEAVQILRDYVSYGAQWDYALQQIAELTDPNSRLGLLEIICTRFETGAQIDASAAYGIYGTVERALWEGWSADYPCIARLLTEVDEIEASRAQGCLRPEPPQYETLTVEELLLAAGPRALTKLADLVEAKARPGDERALIAAFSQGNPFGWYAALRGLKALDRGKHLYSHIFDQAVSRLESLPQARGPHLREIRAIVRTLDLLPPTMTLPLAREWFSSANWNKESVAEDILEQHATGEDIPVVTAALTQHLQAGTENVDTYRTCSLLDILARFPDIGPLPQVERVFVETGYSPARRRAASAMRMNAPQWFAETYAYECLWDCVEESRQIGCASVSIELPGSLERLQTLADDPFEYEHVREAARVRLGAT
jgi:hypothetical protein